MPDHIHVISSDIDGAQLWRERIRHPYHTRLRGKADQEKVNEAIRHLGKSMFTIPGDAWERIFGRRK